MCIRDRAAGFRLAMQLADGPFWMPVVKRAGGIDHFRLQPDAEAQPALTGLASQERKAARQFIRIDLPIAQSGAVVVAGVLVAKPAVIQQEQFRPDFPRGSKQARDAVKIEIEPGRLPIVQQHLPRRVPVAHAKVPRPPVKFPAQVDVYKRQG